MTQFHVDYYVYAEVGPWVDGTMAYAASLQIPMWTAQRWLQFVEARAATGITNVNWSANDKTLTFTASLPTGAEPHTLLEPATFGSDTVAAVAVDGSSVTAPSLLVNGRTMNAITLTAGAHNVAVLYGVPTPEIAIGDVTVTEGHAGTTVANLPLTLSTPSSNSVTVNYQTGNGTAIQPGDYQTGSGTITFAPFVTSRVVPVTIVGDLALEPNETFSVTLSTPSNATIDDGTGIVTISDDDAPPTITITDASVTEGNSGTTPATFTVSLSHASGNPVTVQDATANGTATAGADYTAGSGTLTFNPGVTSLPIAVPVTGETAAEPNETFAVNLTTPVNGVFGDNQGAGTIVNDDSGTIVTTATFQVQAGGDDVTEEAGGFTANGSTVWVGSGETASTSYAGFRFTGIPIRGGGDFVGAARVALGEQPMADDRLRVRHRGRGQQRALLGGQPPVAAHPAGAAGPALVERAVAGGHVVSAGPAGLAAPATGQPTGLGAWQRRVAGRSRWRTELGAQVRNRLRGRRGLRAAPRSSPTRSSRGRSPASQSPMSR